LALSLFRQQPLAAEASEHTAPGTTGWPKRAPPQIAFCRVFLRTEQRSLALKPQHREFPTLTRLVHGMLRYRTKTTAIGQKPG